MRRISLVLTGAVLCALVAFGGSAAAKSSKTCTTNSIYVVGKTIESNLYSRDVTSSQKEYATCGYANKVVKRVAKLGVEEPKSVLGFRCTPTVLTSGQGTEEPQVVRYNCLFRGADTATEIRLKFKVTYNMD